MFRSFHSLGCNVEPMESTKKHVIEFLNNHKIRYLTWKPSSSMTVEDISLVLENLKLDSLEIYYEGKQNLSEIRKWWNLDRLEFNFSKKSVGCMSGIQLTEFSGKVLYLDHCDIRSDDIVKFIRHWMNKHNSRLETLVVDRNHRRLDRNEILRAFETKEWDRNERPLDYVRKLPQTSYAFSWNHKDRDLVREDGMLATIRVKPRQLYFVIWHKVF
uniref:FBA_2 domain-containing protein n=1 Tax=Caenorhabditis japonica TaxID=281687 RepID=A0A8R1IU26_CAEJA